MNALVREGFSTRATSYTPYSPARGPRRAVCTPTPRERWLCASLRHAHAVCRDCDALVQSSANTACPLCRAPRILFVQGDS